MLLDLDDPESILAWWKVWPARHAEFLEHKLRTSPEFSGAIRAVQRRIAADAELSALLASSVREGRELQARRHDGAVAIPAYQLRHREFAAEA